MGKVDNTLKQQVYHKILKSITLGELNSDKILTEKSLMECCQVSRAPVREALVELCNEGVLRSIPCYGYEIIPLTAADIRSVQEYRVVLECGYLTRNWNLISPEHIRSLQAIMDTSTANGVAQDAFSHWRTNMDFHLGLFNIYHNSIASHALEEAMNVQTRAYAQITWERWKMPVFLDGSQSHQVLLESMLAGRWADAVRILETDIMSI